jgi:hypothetical protein
MATWCLRRSPRLTAPRVLHVHKVVASHGKYTRAEPIAPLYEQGRVHHVGYFAELEDQLCQAVALRPRGRSRNEGNHIAGDRWVKSGAGRGI